MEKLLTTEQAADMLAMSPLTLAHWRNIRQGPTYITLGQNEDLSTGRKRVTRYRLSDLQAFISTRATDPRKRLPPPSRRVEPRVLADEEWAAVFAAVKCRDRLGRLNGFINLGHKHRALLDQMFAACTDGQWPLTTRTSPNTTRHKLRKGVRPNGWVLQAFDALSAFPDFPFILAVQYVLIRRNRRKDLPTTALRLRTDAHGPLHGRRNRRGIHGLTDTAERLEDVLVDDHD